MTCTLLLCASSAAAQTKEECVEAHASAQSLLNADELTAAKQRALVCVREACPKVLQSECGGFLERVNADMPSVSLVMLDHQGNAILDAEVTMDGTPVPNGLDGRSRDTDPGPHTFRFERKGHEAIERQVVVREGVRNQLVEVQLPADPSQRPAGDHGDGDAPSAGDGVDPMLVAGLVVGGVAIAGFIVFAGVGGAGMSERSDLETCKPSCSDDEVDPVRTKLVIADVVLAISAVVAATSVVLITIALTGEQDPQGGLELQLAPTSQGGVVGFGGTF